MTTTTAAVHRRRESRTTSSPNRDGAHANFPSAMFRRGAVSLVAAIVLAACGGGGGGGDSVETPTVINTPANTPTQPPVEDFDRRSLLGSYTQRVVIPALRAAAVDADALETAARALAVAAADGSPATAELQTAQSAWRTAMESWQAVEVMQVGPAGSANMVMGGLGLRDEIYSWPTINPCRVDQETVSGAYLNDNFFSVELVNTRGFDAIEYLLFDEGDDNACAAGVDINAEGTWDALVASGDLAARRAAYAEGAAADVAAHAAQLRDAWEPTLGNFAGELSNAGLSGSQFATAQDAVNDVFAALFYVELRVKDRKLAAPAGITPDCADATCPQLLESLWANVSKEHILANLRAAERTFLGGGDSSGVGFDDFLIALGASDLAATMLADLRAAIAATEAVPGTFADALEDDPELVRGVHAALKLFTDNLKSQFVTVLNLEIPSEGAGDND